METSLNISVSPPVLGYIGPIPLTTSFISGLLVTLLLLMYIFYVRAKMSLVPGTAQMVAEGVVEFFHSRLVDAYGDEKKAQRYLPLIVSLFLFVFLANQFTILPLIQSIVYDGAPLFRAPTSHFGMTITLALVVFCVSNVIAISMSPLHYIGNFIRIGKLLKMRSLRDLGPALLDIFLGVLDIIGELAKIVSLSARLFGNIFAGEVMIAVIASLSFYTQFLVPVPFYGLGLLAGVVQALVFAILSLAFISGMHTTIEAAKST